MEISDIVLYKQHHSRVNNYDLIRVNNKIIPFKPKTSILGVELDNQMTLKNTLFTDTILPCGTRGCVLKVLLSAEASQTKEARILAQIKADITTPTTHELHVILQSDNTSWYTKMTKYFR